MAIDRGGPADTGAEDVTIGGDDTVGDLDTRDAGGKEVALSIGSTPLAAGVGDIRCTVEGVADRAVVGDDGAVVGGSDEPRTAITGSETAAADPAARGLATEACPSLSFETG